jgi:sugar phosphate isomerase/epimerase
MSRRRFLAASGAASLQVLSAAKRIPVGLEMYSVRDELAKDVLGSVRTVAQIGYEVLEFFAPYLNWSVAQAKDVRTLMNDLGVRCNSTHNNGPAFTADGIAKAIELNGILGSRYLVMASAPGRPGTVDAWKKVADQLTSVAEQLKPAGMRTGYHNHAPEFRQVEGKRPMDILAANTPKEVMLQFDVGTCVEAGQDPVAWIDANPGRINSVHCKDWAAGPPTEKGYRVLFGEGECPWGRIFDAVERAGGVEYYLIEQEGSRFSQFETAQRCLDNWKKLKT